MLITNKALKAKRKIKKNLSSKVAYKLLSFTQANYPDDERMIKKMIRQIKCSGRMDVYEDGTVKTIFCKEKTCLICNSIRLAMFLDKYLDQIEEKNYLYHITLTVRNPRQNELKGTINDMYNFFRNSSIRKNKEFIRLNRSVKMIRSFEATLNYIENTYHPHFHILLAGENEQEIKVYGNLLLDYWLKYFLDKSDRKAQYIGIQERSTLENFKYLFKLNDLSDANIGMLYQLLKALDGKRLFLAKNIKLDKEKKEELKNKRFNDIKNINMLNTFNYFKEIQNWIDENTGEILVKDSDLEFLRQENIEKKNYRNLSLFLKKEVID